MRSSQKATLRTKPEFRDCPCLNCGATRDREAALRFLLCTVFCGGSVLSCPAFSACLGSSTTHRPHTPTDGCRGISQITSSSPSRRASTLAVTSPFVTVPPMDGFRLAGTGSASVQHSPLRFTAPVVMDPSESARFVRSVTLIGCSVEVRDAPLPVELADDHVEVRVSHCGLSFTDNYQRLGIILNQDYCVHMGSECAGTVTRVGSNVSDLQAGQRVLCLQMQGGLFRHTVQLPRQNCFVLPGHITTATAVALGLNFLVAHLCLFEVGRLRAKQTIFMQSIGGSVGTAVIQLARTVPNITILGTASDHKIATLKSFGVNHVFRHGHDYVSKILEAYPQGVDLVINCTGGADITNCLKLLKPCGRMIIIGSNSSAKYPKTTMWGMRSTWSRKRLSPEDIISGNRLISGLNVGSFLESDRKKVRAILDRVFQLRASRAVRPRVFSLMDFERASDALALLWKRDNVGKVLLAVRHHTSPEASEQRATFSA